MMTAKLFRCVIVEAVDEARSGSAAKWACQAGEWHQRGVEFGRDCSWMEQAEGPESILISGRDLHR
jgi:hypothetical protein